jgi:hypothetical protein
MKKLLKYIQKQEKKIKKVLAKALLHNFADAHYTFGAMKDSTPPKVEMPPIDWSIEYWAKLCEVLEKMAKAVKEDIEKGK